MAKRIENLGGEYTIVDAGTGKPVQGERRFRQLHFAEERVRALKEASRTVERARDDKGRLKGDDPDTPEINEAWEGGKAPKKSAKKKAPAKKQAAPKKKASKK